MLTPSPTLVETMVWPSLNAVEPAIASTQSEVTVTGSGGYIRFNGGYNESARSFQLFFDGEPVESSFGCYVNFCQGTFTAPADTSAGAHEVSVEGGAMIAIEILP